MAENNNLFSSGVCKAGAARHLVFLATWLLGESASTWWPWHVPPFVTSPWKPCNVTKATQVQGKGMEVPALPRGSAESSGRACGNRNVAMVVLGKHTVSSHSSPVPIAWPVLGVVGTGKWGERGSLPAVACKGLKLCFHRVSLPQNCGCPGSPLPELEAEP